MRILHVINSVSPLEGGTSECVAQIGGFLASVGEAVEVASCSDTPNLPWVRHFPVPVHALGPSYLRYAFTPRLTPWLRQNIRRYDAVVINGLWQFQGYGSYSVLQGGNTPYFVYVHGMLGPWTRRAYPGKYLKKLAYWALCEYRLLRDASGVFFTSNEESQLARTYFPFWHWKGVVVGNGIASPDINDELQRHKLLASFPHLAGKRILLFLGRIHVKKGLDLLLQAYSRVRALDPALHLLIAGDGDANYMRRLRALATSLELEEKVTWAGLVQGDLKWGAFRQAELFVLPSHQENFGISVVEALACATPVLISDKVNIWRDVQSDGACLVCSDDVDSLTQSISHWLTLPSEELERFRARAAECFRKRFSIATAAENVRNAIRGALSPSNA